MNKPLLLTLTQSRESDIREMLKNIYPTFDGIIAVLNQPCIDKTEDVLKENIGNGKIIKTNWTPHHSFLMNHLFFYGNIKDGQYCMYLDSPESLTDEGIKIIPTWIELMEKQKIDALYWDGRPYFFKYTPYLEYFNAVHWGIRGFVNPIQMPQELKDKYLVNRRLNNKDISWCYNGSKYFVCYPLSNDIQSTYLKYGQETVNRKENERREIRKFFKENLKLDLDNLDDLIEYMKKIELDEIQPDEIFINFVENNFRLSELYQLKVLNMSFINEIAKNRHCWSFREHLNSKNGWVNNYIGEINILNKQFNYPLE